MKAHKNISLIIFLFVLSIFQGCEKQSSESEKKAILKITDENTTWATGRDPTTNEDFSCIILLCQNQYIMGEPVRVKVRLTNQINRNVTIRDCVQHYPFYSFEVTDPAWRLLESSKKLKTSFTELNPEFKTIKPNESYYVEIDLADWYNLSQIGRYSIRAKWCCFMKRAPYECNSPITTIVIAPREQKEWFDPNSIPYGPTWTGIPDNWKRDDLWQKLTVYLTSKFEKHYPRVHITRDDLSTGNGPAIKNGQLRFSYHTKEYIVERPSGKHKKAEMVFRKETGPQPNGLILNVWLSEQVDQIARPQLLDRIYWNLYATQIYLPEMRLYLKANISYGTKTDKNILSKSMDLAGWLEDVVEEQNPEIKSNAQVETQAGINTHNSGFNRPVWAKSHAEVKNARYLLYMGEQISKEAVVKGHAAGILQGQNCQGGIDRSGVPTATKSVFQVRQNCPHTYNTTIKDTTVKTIAPPTPLPAGGQAPATLEKNVTLSFNRPVACGMPLLPNY